jgi:AmpD protein
MFDHPETETNRSGWSGGWLEGVRHCSSPNFGVRPDGTCVDLIVVHSISLPPGEYGTGDVERLFTNTLDWDAHPYFEQIRGLEVSAHFVIDRQGVVTQFVDVVHRAWHAGASCWRGKNNCNDHSVGIELEGLEGETFEPAQYMSLAGLCQHIARVCPIAHVAGHEHIAPGRKQDPGPGFEWPRLATVLGWHPACFPPNVM